MNYQRYPVDIPAYIVRSQSGPCFICQIIAGQMRARHPIIYEDDHPLAMAVFGGLLSGTILSLFDIPIMHTYVDDAVRWLNRTFLNREWEWKAPDADPDETSAP